MKEDNVRRMVHSGRCLNVGAWGCVCAAYEQQSGNDSDECNDPGDDIRSIENLPTIMIVHTSWLQTQSHATCLFSLLTERT